jgi:hypothetical protein
MSLIPIQFQIFLKKKKKKQNQYALKNVFNDTVNIVNDYSLLKLL